MVQDEARVSLTRPLTRRQHECVELVTAGLTSKEIARKLGIAPSTVDNHIAQVMHQFGIPNRAALRKCNLVARTLAIVDDPALADQNTEENGEVAKVRPRERLISFATIIRLRNSILVFSGVSYIALALLIILSTLLIVHVINLYRA